MSREDFIQYVVDAYKKNRVHMGFIPRPRIERDYDLGRFFVLEDNSFIFTGSPRSKTVSIFALYVNPSSRNKGVETAVSLISLLPERHYRVRCKKGLSFWKRMGMNCISTHKNAREKEVYTLEGNLPRFTEFRGQ